MATIVINFDGTDRAALIDRRSFKIVKQVTSQTDVFDFVYKKYGSRSWIPLENKEVIVTLDGIKVFAGYCTRVTYDALPGGLTIYKVHCIDYSYLLNRKLVVGSFEGQTPKQIVDSLLAEYAAGLGITTNNVDTTPTISRIDFNYEPMQQAIQKIAQLVAKEWYIDEDKDIHLFDKLDQVSPLDVTDTNGNMITTSLDVKRDISNMVNSCVVRGGYYEGVTQIDKFTGQTNKDGFLLKYRPKIAGMTVQVDATTYTTGDIGIDGITDPATVEVLVNMEEKLVKFTSGNVPAAGAIITVTYTPLLRVLVKYSDAISIVNYGYREKEITDRSLNSKQAAKDYARSQVLSYKDPIVDGAFDSYTDGWIIGTLVNIDSTIGGIDADFLLYRLTITMQSKNTFKYNIQFTSTQSYGMVEFLQRLLLDPSRRIEFLVEGELEKIEAVLENVILTESIAYTVGGDYLLTEAVEIAEDMEYYLNDPPTWVYAPYSPTDLTDRKRPGRYDRDNTYA